MRRAIFPFLQPKLTLSEQEVRSGLRALHLQGTAMMGLDALTYGGFMAAYALALGANNAQIGILAALPFILQPLQIPAIALVERHRRRKEISVLTMALANALWIPAALIPFFIDAPGAAAISLLLIITAARSAITPFFNVPWMSWLRDLVPPDIRGKFFARRLAYASALGMALGIGGALFADFWKEQANTPDAVAQGFAYPLLIAALTLGVLSWLFMARMPESKMMSVPESERQSVLTSIAAPMRDQNYNRLIRFQFVATLAMYLAVPFFAVYMIEVIGLPVSAVMGFSALSLLANIMFLGAWGRMVDRFGAKAVLSAATSLYFLVILGWAFTTMPERYFLTIPLLVVLHILAGIATAGLNITNGTIAMKLSPSGQSTSYLAASSLAISLGAGLGPLMGGVFADFFSTRSFRISFEFLNNGDVTSFAPLSLTGFDFLFAISFLLGLLVISSLALVKEEGEAPKEAVMNELLAPVRELARPMSSVPGLAQFAHFPLQTVSRTPVPGLDVAIGVTAYQVAETARTAARAASAGKHLTAEVADAVEHAVEGAVDDLRSGVHLAGSQAADLARSVVRGSVQSAAAIEEDASHVLGATVRGLMRAMGRSRHESRGAAYGAGFGAVEAAAETGMSIEDAAAAVIEAARESAEGLSPAAQEQLQADVERGLLDAAAEMPEDEAQRVRAAMSGAESEVSAD